MVSYCLSSDLQRHSLVLVLTCYVCGGKDMCACIYRCNIYISTRTYIYRYIYVYFNICLYMYIVVCMYGQSSTVPVGKPSVPIKGSFKADIGPYEGYIRLLSSPAWRNMVRSYQL